MCSFHLSLKNTFFLFLLSMHVLKEWQFYNLKHLLLYTQKVMFIYQTVAHFYR